ncbi:adenine deaminase [Methanobrevibacter sp.]|uniref:adenine deaminase n=1 Tax=Methanobrevibacter sp. TaxID=66852 RepID=UPI00386545A1
MEFTAYMLDVLTEAIYPVRMVVEDGIFKEIELIFLEEDTVIDVEGVILPGLIDSHIHIESSMVTPQQFAKIAVRHGTTSVVCDPHEIANVGGIDAIEFMIDNASKVPFNFYFTAPSCVPATPFETSGAVLDHNDIEFLLKKDEMVALGEMMNYPGVINGDEEVLKKLEVARQSGKPIDGHAPLLNGEKLDLYVAQGISTEHECSYFSEAMDKTLKGMKIMARDGSSAKNMEALLDIPTKIDILRNQKIFGLVPMEVIWRRLPTPIFEFIVSDDKHPNDLIEGHLDKSLEKAVRIGIDVMKAIQLVTINPANHYGINGGAIVVGAKADFIIVDNLYDFNVLKTYIDGECVFDGENVLFDVEEVSPKNSINASKKTAEDFEISFEGDDCEVNVIKCFNGELLTEKKTAKLKCIDGKVQADTSQDVLKIAVVERYGGNNVSNAFITGFNLKNGAIASSVAHDSHNIVVIGCDSEMMAKAANIVIDNMGGLAIVGDDFEESLSLPIAGLMSNEDVYEVSDKLEKLHKRAIGLGCDLDSPFMTMAFMSLLVIPSIKLSDKGLFDGDAFEFMDVIRD